MTDFDLIVRGGLVVDAAGVRQADAGVSNGLVAAVSDGLEGHARSEVDAAGLHVLRGRTVFDGDRVAAGGGRLLKPAANPDPVLIP